jgi:hypothetical protein
MGSTRRLYLRLPIETRPETQALMDMGRAREMTRIDLTSTIRPAAEALESR